MGNTSTILFEIPLSYSGWCDANCKCRLKLSDWGEMEFRVIHPYPLFPRVTINPTFDSFGSYSLKRGKKYMPIVIRAPTRILVLYENNIPLWTFRFPSETYCSVHDRCELIWLRLVRTVHSIRPVGRTRLFYSISGNILALIVQLISMHLLLGQNGYRCVRSFWLFSICVHCSIIISRCGELYGMKG